MMKKFSTKMLMASTLLSMSFASYAAEIRIAVAGPHSGQNAPFGRQQWEGAKKAAADINKAGGIKIKVGKKMVDHKVKIIKADDACEPKQAVAVAQKMVSSEKVHAVAGHFCSSSTIPAIDIYADAGILMMTPASTNPNVTEVPFKDKINTVLRMCGRDDQQGVVAGNYLINDIKSKRIAVVHDNTTYGKGLADATVAQLKILGVKPVYYAGIDIQEKELHPLVGAIKSAKADAVYYGGLHSQAGVFVRQLREKGSTATFVSGDGIVSEDFVTSAGGAKNVNGVYMTFGADPRKLPNSKKVVDEFKQGGYEPEGYTLYSYATIQAITAAMKGTNSTDGETLAKWLRSNSVETVMGTKAWDAKGDLKIADYVIYQWKQSAKDPKKADYHQL